MVRHSVLFANTHGTSEASVDVLSLLIQCWRMTTFGKFVTQNTVRVLEKVGMVPKGTHDVGEALKTAADALVAGGQQKLFTPMMLFVCKRVSCHT